MIDIFHYIWHLTVFFFLHKSFNASYPVHLLDRQKLLLKSEHFCFMASPFFEHVDF